MLLVLNKWIFLKSETNLEKRNKYFVSFFMKRRDEEGRRMEKEKEREEGRKKEGKE